jgi:hypothetical protein
VIQKKKILLAASHSTAPTAAPIRALTNRTQKDKNRGQNPRENGKGPADFLDSLATEQGAEHSDQVQADTEQETAHDQYRHIGCQPAQGFFPSPASPQSIKGALNRVEKKYRGYQEEQKSDHTEGAGVLHEALDVGRDLFLTGGNQLLEEKALKILQHLGECPQGGE